MNNIISTGSYTQGFSFSYSGGALSRGGTGNNSRGAENTPRNVEETGNGGRNVSRQFLQDQVLGNQRRQLRSRGKQLLNFRFFTGGLETVPENTDSPSLNALIIAGNQDGVNDLEIRILNVTQDGETREVYSSRPLQNMDEQLQELGLDTRGLLMDREI